MTDTTLEESDTTILRQRNRELSILNRIAAELNRSIDLDEALRAALAQVTELLELQTGWVWLLDEESGDSYLAASQNLPSGLAEQPQRMEGRCYCLDTYRSGDLNGAANINVVSCSRLNALVDGTDGLRYHASIPLYAKEEKLGVLNVASRGWRQLAADDLRLLHTVGDMLSIAIERARLFTKSTRMGAVEERNRLARELHDTLAQGLSAVSLQLESADAFLEEAKDIRKARQVVQKALALTQANLDEVRRSVLDLRAIPLEGRSLPEALARLAENQGAESDIAISFEVTGGGRPLSARVESGLYRVAQEAIANVIQHSGADRAAVTLVMTPDEIRLTIADDGRGFDPDKITGHRYGLVGIRERVKLLGGRLLIESYPRLGTRLLASVPLAT